MNKACTQCERRQPLDRFACRKRRNKHGVRLEYSGKCKDCINAMKRVSIKLPIFHHKLHAQPNCDLDKPAILFLYGI